MSTCKQGCTWEQEAHGIECVVCGCEPNASYLDSLELRAEKAEAQVDQLLRFINGIGMSDQYKAFCVKEAKK
jgi:hypothetical protein